MEVWVRSQDKKFFGKIDHICFLELENLFFKKEPSYDKAIRDKKVSYRLDYNGVSLGEYPTKESCLEIIDEIQKLLCQNFCIVRNLFVPEDFEEYIKPTKAVVYEAKNQAPSIEYHEQSVVVYEMPKE